MIVKFTALVHCCIPCWHTADMPVPCRTGLNSPSGFVYFLQDDSKLTEPSVLCMRADAAGKPGYKPNPRLARALDIMFTLHAEHEMNCSTAAARHLASSGVDVYTAIAGARSLPPLWHVPQFFSPLIISFISAVCFFLIIIFSIAENSHNPLVTTE